MNDFRKVSFTVGVLFIIATAAPILSFPFIDIINRPDYLENISANALSVISGSFLELIMALAIAGIAVAMYPVLKKHNETLALGYICARTIEAILFITFAVVCLFSLITLSREYQNAGFPVNSGFHTIGTLLKSVHNFVYLLSGQIIFTLAAAILNYLFYKYRIIPRFISIWGLLGAIILFVSAVMQFFGIITEESLFGTLAFLPIAVNEMVLAVWLIIKGFNREAIV